MDGRIDSRPNISMTGALALQHVAGVNRPQRGRWTQLILPVSDCGSNASVRVASNPFLPHAPSMQRG
jgi:hypothetical protein